MIPKVHAFLNMNVHTHANETLCSEDITKAHSYN